MILNREQGFFLQGGGGGMGYQECCVSSMHVLFRCIRHCVVIIAWTGGASSVSHAARPPSYPGPSRGTHTSGVLKDETMASSKGIN